MNKQDKRGGPYRSRNGIFFGVCAGFAEYFGISAFWLRIITVILFLMTGFWPTMVLYVVAAILMKPSPARPFMSSAERDFYDAYTHAPKYTVQHIHEKFANLDRRIQRMEDIVTTRGYEWDRKMNSHR